MVNGAPPWRRRTWDPCRATGSIPSTDADLDVGAREHPPEGHHDVGGLDRPGDDVREEWLEHEVVVPVDEGHRDARRRRRLVPGAPCRSALTGQSPLGAQPPDQFLGRGPRLRTRRQGPRSVGCGPMAAGCPSPYALSSLASASGRMGSLEPIPGPDQADDDTHREDQRAERKSKGRDGHARADDQRGESGRRDPLVFPQPGGTSPSGKPAFRTLRGGFRPQRDRSNRRRQPEPDEHDRADRLVADEPVGLPTRSPKIDRRPNRTASSDGCLMVALRLRASAEAGPRRHARVEHRPLGADRRQAREVVMRRRRRRSPTRGSCPPTDRRARPAAVRSAPMTATRNGSSRRASRNAPTVDSRLSSAQPGLPGSRRSGAACPRRPAGTAARTSA